MADSNLELDRLKLLYDYTKFHIGMYGTLMAVFSGIMTFGSQDLPSAMLSFAWPQFAHKSRCDHAKPCRCLTQRKTLG